MAVRYALDLGLDAIADRTTMLGEMLRERVSAIGGEVHDKGTDRCGIVVFTVPGVDPTRAVAALRDRAMHLSVAQARTAMPDLGARGIATAIRASVHYYNTADEIDAVVTALDDLR
mgnify:CR=1 FL=1